MFLLNFALTDFRGLKISKAKKGQLAGDNNPSKRKEVKEKISNSWKTRKTKNKYITPYGEYYFLSKAYNDFPDKANLSKYLFKQFFNLREKYIHLKL